MKKFLSALIVIMMVAGMLTSCGLTVPRPEIKEGEFDFSVTYEVNGEEKTVSGVYACEYDGTSWALDSGFNRNWKGSIVGDDIEMEMVILELEDGGKIILDFNLNPDYFMGDFEEGIIDPPAPRLIITHENNDSGEISFTQDMALLEENGVRLVSYQYESPIENSFK